MRRVCCAASLRTDNQQEVSDGMRWGTVELLESESFAADQIDVCGSILRGGVDRVDPS